MDTQTIISVDPGLKGGVSIIDLKNFTIKAQMVPLIKEKGKKDKFDNSNMVEIIRGFPKNTPFYIEQVNAMPGQGVTSMFRFGLGYGIWQGIARAFEYDIKFVSPRKWKNIFNLTKDKNDSRDCASRLFPECKELWKLKKHDGVAESVLIGVHEIIGCINTTKFHL